MIRKTKKITNEKNFPFTKDESIISAISNKKNLFDRNKIDWSELEFLGLTKEEFGRSKVFETMLMRGIPFPVSFKSMQML